MSGGQGKRVGARRAEKSATPWPAILLHAVAITACIVAWGYLVWAAIDFGSSARDGGSGGWGLLALATLGAIACLFAALLLGVRLARVMGLTQDRSTPRVVGGHRAIR